MNTDSALSLTITAALGSGWFSAFSNATKNTRTFESTSIRAFGNAQKSAQAAENELRRFQKRIGGIAQTQEQQAIFDKLNKTLETSKARLEQATRSLKTWTSVADAERTLRLQESVQQTSAAFSNLKGQVASVFSVLSGLFIGSIANTARQIDDASRSAENLGVSFETLQRFQFAGAKAGISAEKTTSALTEMNKRISEAATGTGEAAKVLDSLGLSATALNAMDAVKKFELIARAMGKVKNAADQTRIADKLFGGEAAKTIPALVREGWAQISADMDAANAHVLQNKSAVTLSRSYLEATEKMSATFNTFKQNAVVALLTPLRNLADALSWLITSFQGLAPVVTYISAALVAAKTAMTAWSAIVFLGQSTLTAYAVACKTVAVAQLFFKTTIAPLLTALVAQTVAISKNAIAWTASTARAVAHATATTALTAITKAAAAAQWALNAALSANPIGIVITAVAALAAGFVWLWNNCDTFREGVLAVCAAVGNAFSWLWDSLSSGAGAAWEFVSSAASSAWSAITNGAAAAWTKLKDICGKIIDIFKKVMEFSPIGLAIKAGSAIAGFFSTDAEDENQPLAARVLDVPKSPDVPAARVLNVPKSPDVPAVATPTPLAARSPFTAVIDAFGARLAPTPAPQQIPLGEITAPLASPASPARGNTQRGNVITDNSTQNFTIVQQPGEDAESLAQRIAKIIAGDYAFAAAAMI